MQFSENLRAKMQKTSKRSNPKRKPARESHATLEKFGQKKQSQEAKKTIKGGPRDPCANSKKTGTKWQIQKENRHAQPQQCLKTWVQPKQALGLKARPKENLMGTK